MNTEELAIQFTNISGYSKNKSQGSLVVCNGQDSTNNVSLSKLQGWSACS